MENQVLLQTLIPIATAFAGYGISEYQNRKKPFVTFDGIIKSGKGADIIKIPEEAVKTLKDALYCKGLLGEIKHGVFLRIFKRCYNMKKNGLECINSLEKLIATDDKIFFIESLSEVIGHQLVDEFIMVLLVNDILDFKNYTIEDPKIEFTIDEKDGDGFFHLPQNSVSFGRSLNNKAIILHTIPFIKIIQSLNRETIQGVFTIIKKHFQEEYNKVVTVIDKLIEIDEKYVKYGFSFSVTNLNNTPVAINNIGFVKIKKGKNNYPLKVNLSIVVEDGSSDGLNHPLSVKSGETKQIRWMTEEYIIDEDNGEDILNAYKVGDAKFKISFDMHKMGLIKKFKYNSQYYKFKD